MKFLIKDFLSKFDAWNCEFGSIYRRNPLLKTSFFGSVKFIHVAVCDILFCRNLTDAFYHEFFVLTNWETVLKILEYNHIWWSSLLL